MYKVESELGQKSKLYRIQISICWQLTSNVYKENYSEHARLEQYPLINAINTIVVCNILKSEHILGLIKINLFR